MAIKMMKCESDQEAMKKIGEIIKAIKERGWDPFNVSIGGHVNPGDAFDAFEETGLLPSEEDILTSKHASPLAAFVMWQEHPSDEATWRKRVDETFDLRYKEGYLAGFSLHLPVDMEDYFENAHFIRGVYDGVMSRAAVF